MSIKLIYISISLLFAVSNVESKSMNTLKTVNLSETNKTVVNPGKGWIIYGPDVSSIPQPDWLKLCAGNPFIDITSDVWNIGSVVYMRYHWSDIEPTEGNYNWQIIDNPIRLAKKHGKQFAFGIMSCNSCMSTQAIPQYVFDAGAKLVNVNSIDNIKNVPTINKTTPFNDSVYIQKLAKFLKALGDRYDGHETIAFFDIRSYGNFGENHVGSLNNMIPQINSDEFKNLHVKMHKDAFRKTKLVTASSHKLRAFSSLDDDKVWEWCVKNNVGLRWDGYLFSNNSSNMVEVTKTALKPAIGSDFGILECWQPYGQEKNYLNFDAWKEAVKSTQSSYCSLANWSKNGVLFLNENKTFVHELNNILGYHFVVTEVTYSPSLLLGEKGTLKIKLQNKGAAPILIPASLKLALFSKSGKIIESINMNTINLFDWKPGKEVELTTTLQFRKSKNATTLALGIFSENETKNPDILFANKHINKQGWLIISE